MSTKNGPSRFDGIAMHRGFVPRRASRPPNGATPLAVRPESAVMMPDHSRLGRHQGVVGEPPDMTLAPDRGHGHVRSGGLVDGHPHRPLGDDEAEAEVPVDDGRRRALAQDLERRAGHDVTLADPFDVEGDVDDPVRVVAGEVRGHAVPGHGLRLLPAHPRRPERPERLRLELRGRDPGHRQSPACALASGAGELELEVPGEVDPGVLAHLGDEGVDHRLSVRLDVDGREVGVRVHVPERGDGLPGVREVVHDDRAAVFAARAVGVLRRHEDLEVPLRHVVVRHRAHGVDEPNLELARDHARGHHPAPAHRDDARPGSELGRDARRAPWNLDGAAPRRPEIA